LANDETAYDKTDSEIEEYIKTLPNEAEIDKFEELLEKEYEALLQAHIADIEKDADKYAKDFIKAMKNGDEEKAEKVLEEAEKHCLKLRDADQGLFSEAFFRKAYSSMGDAE
jgi:ClpP class serine protease